MPISLDPREEHFFTGVGSEVYPQSIFLKDILWNISVINGRLYLSSFGGTLFRIVRTGIKVFTISQAKKPDGSLYVDRFWLWVSDLHSCLTLYEIEPFELIPPVIHYIKENIQENILSISTEVEPNQSVKIFCIYNTTPLREYRVVSYTSIYDESPYGEYVLRSIDPSRLDDNISFFNRENNELYGLYLQSGSPPNVYIESYSILVPQNLGNLRDGYTTAVTIFWDPVDGSDSYVVERDLTLSFSSPVVAYYGSNTSFVDTLLGSSPFYFRVKAQNTVLEIESFWSEPTEVPEVFLDPPQNLSHSRIESTPSVGVSWDAVIGADFYYVERDLSPFFLFPEVVYFGGSVSFVDTIPETQVAYCRVKALSTVLDIESPWSEVMEIPAVPVPEDSGFKRLNGPSIIFD